MKYSEVSVGVSLALGCVSTVAAHLDELELL